MDPDAWFLEIDKINDETKSIEAKYEEEVYEMNTHLLGYLPQGYQDVVTNISGNEKDMTVDGYRYRERDCQKGEVGFPEKRSRQLEHLQELGHDT
jgi:hypothetical protein